MKFGLVGRQRRGLGQGSWFARAGAVQPASCVFLEKLAAVVVPGSGIPSPLVLDGLVLDGARYMAVFALDDGRWKGEGEKESYHICCDSREKEREAPPNIKARIFCCPDREMRHFVPAVF